MEYMMKKRPMTPADLRPEVITFAMEMEIRLRANDHKVRNGAPMWKSDTPASLFRRLQDEVQELADVLEDIDAAGTGITPGFGAGLCLESLDVANFAMMIFDMSTLDVDPPVPHMIEGQRRRSACLECAHLRREIAILAEEYPDVRGILDFEDDADHPDLDEVGLMTGRLRTVAGAAVAAMIDSGAPTSGDSVIEVPMSIRDWNTFRSTLVWLTGTD